MLKGVFGVPVTWFVLESVGWKAKVPGRFVTGAILHSLAVVNPVLPIAPNTVAVAPTCTDRLLGRSAASKPGSRRGDWTALSASARPYPKAKSNSDGPRRVAVATRAP